MGNPLGATYTAAVAIGNDGTVIARKNTAGCCDGVRWDRDGKITDLGTLPNGTSSTPFAVNNHGTIVGIALQTGVWSRAVMWDRNGRAIDLGVAPGDKASSATNIADDGTILGSGGNDTEPPTQWSGGSAIDDAEPRNRWARWRRVPIGTSCGSEPAGTAPSGSALAGSQ